MPLTQGALGALVPSLYTKFQTFPIRISRDIADQKCRSVSVFRHLKMAPASLYSTCPGPPSAEAPYTPHSCRSAFIICTPISTQIRSFSEVSFGSRGSSATKHLNSNGTFEDERNTESERVWVLVGSPAALVDLVYVW
jgi:hypothetical protein